MDLNVLTIEQLKALGYDLINELQITQNNLNTVNILIERKNIESKQQAEVITDGEKENTDKE